MSAQAESSRVAYGRDSTGVPGPGVAAALLVVLGLAYLAVDAFSPGRLPTYAESARQVMGMALMLILLPAYLPLAAWLGQRRALALVEELRPRLPDPRAADAAVEAIRTGLRRYWLPSLVLGLVLGLFNTNPIEAFQDRAPEIAVALSLGQLLLWSLVGLLFGVRLPVSNAFRELARVVPLDLHRPERLRPISQAGVTDIAIIAGALLLTPLQSIDAEFRWYNYRFGLLVALPSATLFLLWPVWPLQRRNQAERAARLAEVERLLDEAPPPVPATEEGSRHLETLLAHRDRLRSARTWPLGPGLLSRVLLYLVIPPMAWAGAAVVERIVDRLLG